MGFEPTTLCDLALPLSYWNRIARLHSHMLAHCIAL